MSFEILRVRRVVNQPVSAVVQHRLEGKSAIPLGVRLLVELDGSGRALDHPIRTQNQGRRRRPDAIRFSRYNQLIRPGRFSPTFSAGPAQIAQLVEQRTRNA